jgi:type VI secretion system Hcp family effector
VAVALVAGAATAVAQLSDNFTNPPAPVPGHGQLTFLSMTGQHTGAFTGGVTQKGHVGAIGVLGLEAGLTVSVGSTGQPNGRAVCSGISFRKATDRATPLLFAAAGNNELITTATFTEYQTSTAGGQTQALQIKLTNAYITAVHHVDSTTSGPYEDVTLEPQKVTFTWKPAGTVAVYNCFAAA